MAKALAKTKANGVPATMDYGDDAGAGFEDMNNEDFTVPFLTILQALSPAVQDEVDGAKSGAWFNTVTEEIFGGKDGVRFVPCHRTHRWNEWRPREQGGGLVGTHYPEDEMIQHAKSTQAFGEYQSPEGNDLVDTFDVWGLLLLDDGTYDHVILSFAKTKIKLYKRWATQMVNMKTKQGDGRFIQPPMFAHVWRLTTVQEESASGKFWNIRIKLDGDSAEECRLAPDSELYLAAKSFRDMAVSGAARAAVDKAEDTSGGGEAKEVLDDEIPF